MSTTDAFRQRLQLFREDCSSAKLDAALVTSPANIRYLCGFTGSNGGLLVTETTATLVTDGRYTLQASQETAGAGVRVKIARGSGEQAWPALLKRARRIGFENYRVRYGQWQTIAGHLPLGATLEPMGETIEKRRMVKSDGEVSAIRSSVELNSKAFTAAVGRFRSGMSETDLAAEIEYQMRLLGAERPAFDTIVAFRAKSALPHAHPGASKLDRNGLILIDMGSFRGGYASDMTRCIHLGKPGNKTRDLYRAVLESQLSGVDAVRPGVSAGSVDSAARKILRRHGLERAFVHSTGHGLGLEIHEAPRLGHKEKVPLAAGMTVTIEPGAYLDGDCGVRIEDTVLVTPTGVEVLTPTTKELITL